MYHLRLIKALSYSGIVSATKKNPDVYTEDKATADKAVATGYFALVGESEAPAAGEAAAPVTDGGAHLDKGQLEGMNFNDLKKLAADMGVNTKGLRSKADFVAAIAAAEITPGPETDEEGNEVDYGEDDLLAE